MIGTKAEFIRTSAEGTERWTAEQISPDRGKDRHALFLLHTDAEPLQRFYRTRERLQEMVDTGILTEVR